MQLTVQLFGPAREVAGASTATLTVDPPVTAEELLGALVAARPELRALVARARVAVNRAYVAPDDLLAADDEIAIIPPVGGG